MRTRTRLEPLPSTRASRFRLGMGGGETRRRVREQLAEHGHPPPPKPIADRRVDLVDIHDVLRPPGLQGGTTRKLCLDAASRPCYRISFLVARATLPGSGNTRDNLRGTRGGCASNGQGTHSATATCHAHGSACGGGKGGI